MKKIFVLACIVCMAFIFNSCVAGYVAERPNYIDGVRPNQPSNAHVWIGGEWGWNNRSHNYVQRNGAWRVPSRGRSYAPGHWNTNPRGNYWVRGQWR